MLTDRFGREIKQGEMVTYPTRHGSSLDVVDGVVTDVKYFEGTAYNYQTRQYEPVSVPRVYLRVKGDTKDRYTEMLDRLTVVCMKGRRHVKFQ